MIPAVKERSPLFEIMDREVRSYEETAAAYRLIRRVNRWLFGTRVILSHLERYSRNWARPPARADSVEPPSAACSDRSRDSLIRILDVGSGAADIPQAIVNWARRKGFRVWVVALDLSPHALGFAREELIGYPEIQLVRASSFQLPFRESSFDYVVTSMFFHHLRETEVVHCLKTFDRLAKRGLIVNDLLRRLRAYAWIFFFSRFTRNEIFRYDAPLSVLRGYRRPEVEAILDEAGLPYLRFSYHFGHRFAIAGEKENGVRDRAV